MTLFMHTFLRLRFGLLLFASLICPSLTVFATPQANSTNSPHPDNVIVVIGDSLSAEYGIQRGSGWTKLLQERLNKNNWHYVIRNASISGDTSSGGLSRLKSTLDDHEPSVVVLELGSNDALRGLSLEMTRNNLAQMIEQIQERGASVVLIGMQIPPNYGQRYANQFKKMYADLADQYQLAFVPFFLEGIALSDEYFQDDRLHPNESAQAILAENVWTSLEKLLNALNKK